MRRRSITMSLAAASSLAAAVLAAPTAQAGTALQAIPNSKPDWVSNTAALAPASAGETVNARVYLAPKGGVGAEKAAALAVSTPGNKNYRHFLTVGQFQKAYEPTAASVKAVSRWLTSAGLKVTSVEPDNRYVTVTGTVAAAQKAFSTKINRYRHNGQLVSAPSTALTTPGAVAASVLTVTGLDTTFYKATPASTPIPPPAGFRNGRPCSIYYGQLSAKYEADFSTKLPTFNGKTLPYAVCGYTGPQLRAAYEQNTSLDGSGVTVGIVDAYGSPTLAADAERYAEQHGDGSYAPGQYSQNVYSKPAHFADCQASGWFSEQSLDVEAVHAMAPAANVRYYGSASCSDDDFVDTLARVVNEDRVQIVSNSWGEPEEGESADSVAAFEQVFLQAALEGISVLFSSGDNGDELQNTAIKQADYPTTDPFVTAVGGTSTAIDGNGALAFETGWGTQKYSLVNGAWSSIGYLYGAGGGASALFNKPAYQSGVAPGPYRQVPDVAMDADPTTGMLIGLTQAFPGGNQYGEYRIGGTSLASPLFAGMTALALQHAGSASGLLNPAIYQNARTGVFTDVKGTPPDAGNIRVDFANGLDASNGLLYSVRTFNQDSSLTIGTGWDNVTGVGSPNTGWLTALG